MRTRFLAAALAVPLAAHALSPARAVDRSISVLDYGQSVGTGGDDSAAINAAIAAAEAPGGAGRVLFPRPPSGFYNVCADAVRIQTSDSTPVAVVLEGDGSGQVALRALPGCTSGAVGYAVVYVNAGWNALPKSANRLEIRNLRIDGNGISLCPLAVDYAIGLNLSGNVIRNAKAGATGAADVCIAAGYETSIDETNRLENVNDPGRTLYTAATLPDYNFKTSGTDSRIAPVAVNARIANFFQAKGGNNNFTGAHGWGYANNDDGQGDFRPQYSFVIEGKTTILGAVADSFTIGGFWLRNTINDNSGAILAYSEVFGPIPATGRGIIIDPAVRNTVVVGNNLLGIPAASLGIDIGSGLDGSNVVWGNRNATLNSGLVSYGGGPNHLLSIVPTDSRTYLVATNRSGNAADLSGLELTAQGQHGFINFATNGATQFQVYNPAGTAANFGVVAGAPSGGSPSLTASGSDADIPFTLAGKGRSGALTGIFTRAGDPDTTDIPDGRCADWNNTAAGTYRHVCNSGGTLLGVTLN